MQFLALDVVTDLTSFAVDYLPLFLAVAILIAVMMWVLAYIARYFEYLKMLESPYLDKETLDFVHKVLVGVWVSVLAILILFVLSYQVDVIREGLKAFILRAPALFIVVFVIFIAAVIVRMLHRFAAFLRGELKVKPRRLAPPRALSFTELFLKYLIYAIAGVVAFLGGVGALPPDDQQYKDLIFSYISVPPPAVVLGFVVAVVAVFIISRFVDSVFEDLKRRSTRFNPKIVEELKSTAKFAVYVAGAIIILIVAVDLILTAEQLLVFVVAVIMVVLIGTLIAFDTIRNGLAGVTLMLADRFSMGDRIRIDDGQESTVDAMGLLTTQVKTVGGNSITYPNSVLLGCRILNVSRSKSGTIVLDLFLDFSIPFQKVRAAIQEAVEKTAGMDMNPPPQVLSTDVRGSVVSYRLTARTKDVLRSAEIRSGLIASLQDVFRREGLSPKFSNG